MPCGYFFDFLNLGSLIERVPPRFVRLRLIGRKLPGVLSEVEVIRLVDACQDGLDRTIVELHYGFGCRVGELAAIQVKDIGIRKIRTEIQTQNGESPKRVIVLCNFLAPFTKNSSPALAAARASASEQIVVGGCGLIVRGFCAAGPRWLAQTAEAPRQIHFSDTLAFHRFQGHTNHLVLLDQRVSLLDATFDQVGL